MNFNNIINRIKLINPNIKFDGSLDENNLKTGYWEEYWYNGKIHSKGNYVNGIKHGYWECFYENGNLAWKGNIINGKEDGYWERYYSYGKLMLKGNYINGIFYELK
jgi:antitoxin component YwqK of YwqJK toxin-antitoxin module